MRRAEAIALGLLQGPAELLPVSSSAHVGLVLGGRLTGLAFERVIESRLGTPRSIAAGLVAGSAAMVIADRTPARRPASAARARDGAWLGAAQALALIPGVSRSGATLAAARARGFGSADAAALSREVALGVLAGATALKAARLVARRPAPETLRTLTAGAATATLSTAAALQLKGGQTPLSVWAAYRTALAGAVIWQDRRR